jgi:hypothetical protein
MVATLKTRLDRLEAQAQAARQAWLESLSDEELEAIIAGGDPEGAAIIHALTDEELEILATSPPGKAERFFERMAQKYAGVVCQP